VAEEKGREENLKVARGRGYGAEDRRWRNPRGRNRTARNSRNFKGNDWIFTHQAAKSSGARTDETFIEEGWAFGYKEEGWLAEKWRIVTVMQAIERTPPLAPASKIAPIASAEATAEVDTSGEAAAAAEAVNLESTLSGIDKLLLDMAEEETAAAAEKVMDAVPDKGKKIADVAMEENDFDLRNLVGQELSEAEKKELQEYGISCGYHPGAMLFGGIDEGAWVCIRDRAGAKIIGTLLRSVGFPKLETDISGYRRQHIVGSLFYCNFKVKFLLLGFFYFCDEAKFSNVGLFLQSMLLSKALRMQQDLEDKKNEIIIEGLENKIKDYEASLEKKDFLL
jgi:hypothetical protein